MFFKPHSLFRSVRTAITPLNEIDSAIEIPAVQSGFITDEYEEDTLSLKSSGESVSSEIREQEHIHSDKDERHGNAFDVEEDLVKNSSENEMQEEESVKEMIDQEESVEEECQKESEEKAFSPVGKEVTDEEEEEESHIEEESCEEELEEKEEELEAQPLVEAQHVEEEEEESCQEEELEAEELEREHTEEKEEEPQSARQEEEPQNKSPIQQEFAETEETESPPVQPPYEPIPMELPPRRRLGGVPKRVNCTLPRAVTRLTNEFLAFSLNSVAYSTPVHILTHMGSIRRRKRKHHK